MERVRRVELPTLCLASIRSSQLSYTRAGKISTLIKSPCQFSNSSTVNRLATVEGEKKRRDN
jgi:hypothetical protein